MELKIRRNIDWIFPKTADQSYLVKIVLIMHNNCSQAVIADNCLFFHIRSKILKQISAFKQTDGWPACIILHSACAKSHSHVTNSRNVTTAGTDVRRM